MTMIIYGHLRMLGPLPYKTPHPKSESEAKTNHALALNSFCEKRSEATRPQCAKRFRGLFMRENCCSFCINCRESQPHSANTRKPTSPCKASRNFGYAAVAPTQGPGHVESSNPSGQSPSGSDGPRFSGRFYKRLNKDGILGPSLEVSFGIHFGPKAGALKRA